jgi:hypothetical protein
MFEKLKLEDVTKLTPKKWDRFSKWLTRRSELYDWQEWFEKRGIECEIVRDVNRFCLMVNQRWSVPVK